MPVMHSNENNGRSRVKQALRRWTRCSTTVKNPPMVRTRREPTTQSGPQVIVVARNEGEKDMPYYIRRRKIQREHGSKVRVVAACS